MYDKNMKEQVELQAQRELKHIRIINSLKRLRRSIIQVGRLDLAVRTGEMTDPETKRVEAHPEPFLSLGDLLIELPKDLQIMAEELDSLVESLKEQLF